MVRARQEAGREVESSQSQDASSLVGYVDAARQALRTTDPANFGMWREAYESGLREAYRRKDLDALVSIAVFGAACLDAQGYHNEALDQLDFAMSMSRRDPDAAAYLLSLRAGYESLCGYADRAQASLASAEEFIADAKTPRARLGYRSFEASVACITLSGRADEELSSSIPLCDEEGLDWLSSALRCWFIPYLIAEGKRRTAQPWITTLRLQAEAANHPARIVDATVFDLATRTLSAPMNDEDVVAPARRALNVNALWRVGCLNLHSALLSDDPGLIDRSAALLAEIAPVVPPAFIDGIDALDALISAYRTGAIERLATPKHVSLVNLPAIFAGIEAVAIAGSQENAAEWRAWSDAEIPEFVVTSAEWPVSLARIRGLLHVRAGSVQSGVRLLREAVRWSEQQDYAVEVAISRLQLGEVLSHGGVRTGRMGEARALRRSGWDGLPPLGVPPAPQAYAATRAVSLSRDDLAMPRLTAREVDILALLAEGLSYKEIGERLGISWRTAQLHANRVYSKLGVHGKMQAVEVGRELKIL